jgi:Tfp pilus assembly protein PilN
MDRTINLIPEEVRRAWRLRRWRRAFAAAVVVYLAFLGFIYLGQRSEIRLKLAEAAALDAERAELVSRNAGYADLSRRFADIQRTEAELKTRLDVSGSLALRRVSWSTVLKRVSRDMPAGVWLKTLSTSDADGAQGKKLRFLGSALTGKAAADLVFALENTAYLTDVTLSYLQKKETTSANVYEFEIYATLKKTDEIMHEW